MYRIYFSYFMIFEISLAFLPVLGESVELNGFLNTGPSAFDLCVYRTFDPNLQIWVIYREFTRNFQQKRNQIFHKNSDL